MNLFHRWYCGRRRWAEVVEGSLLPWVLDGVELGTGVLEIGPGPGPTTDVLRHRAASLTAVELDPALAAGPGRRLGGSGVRVVRGGRGGPAVPRRVDRRGGGADHAPPRPVGRLQDQVLGEAGRCLRPGGLLVGFGDVSVTTGAGRLRFRARRQ